MFFDFIIFILGQLTFLVIVLIIIGIILLFLLGRLFYKKEILILPKLFLFIYDIFYLPLKKLYKVFNKNSDPLDEIGINIRNKMHKKRFYEIPAEKTVIFLPHCLRHRDCQGILTKHGIDCNKCGKCSIGVIKKRYESKKFPIFIVPGSSFAKKILKEIDFEAIFGIACHKDLVLGMIMVSDIPTQGILLKKSGCFETKTNLKEVFEILDQKS